jgi:hypothetical protein
MIPLNGSNSLEIWREKYDRRVQGVSANVLACPE